MNRRQFGKKLGSGAVLLGSSLGTAGLLGSILFRSDLQASQPGAARRKLLQIVVPGGWDSALCTDPVTDQKLATGTYASDYRNKFGIHSVPGKSGLVVGEGLVDALPAFSKIPTCFVNGVFMEVSAHEIALNYMLSGVQSLTRTREYPSLAALLGSKSPSFPPHVVLGQSPPLGNTRDSAPPLHALSVGVLSAQVKEPGNQWTKSSSIQVGEKLLKDLDGLALQRLSAQQKAAVKPWQNASKGVQALYDRNLSDTLIYTPEIKDRYLGSEDWQGPGALAGAYLVLKSGLSPYVTVSFMGEFDSHNNHFGRHFPSLQAFSKSLAVLVEDLLSTPDPDDATRTLADTTTVLIVSEFVRTPKLNGAQGTDHWQSSSAILMGAGVADGRVIGRTGNDALPLGWQNGQETGRNAGTELRPEHLVSAVLHFLGKSELAKGISDRPLLEVFENV